ncbi:MAG: rpfC [Phycisphaerales bacterium]|nr:rpfC [Phycisphaerales bacterium]
MISSPFVSRIRGVPVFLACAVIAIGLVVLVGWATGNSALKSVVPGMITMKVNTAIRLIMLAAALLLLSRTSEVSRLFLRVCLAIVAGAAIITLAEYVFHVDLRIDNLMFYDHESPRFPGRNAPATNIAFLGIVVGLYLLHVRKGVAAAQCVLALVAAAPLATLGGYLYRTRGMYENAPYPVIALNTSISLLMLCLGGLLIRPDLGVMAVITSKSLAGSVARKLLPAAVLVPLLTGLLVLGGQRAQLYTDAFGSALLVAFCSIFFAGAVCWAVTLLWNSELLRTVAERDRQRLLESERIARNQAEAANRMKDEFLSVVSHELRTPLNAIYGWTQILRGGAGPEDLEQGLDVIERNAKSQTQIIDDLLDMSRIVSGKIKLDVTRVELSKIAADALMSLRPAMAEKGVKVELVPADQEFWVEGDSIRLQQVFWNLLTNAIKFTPRDGGIRVTSKQINHSVAITVADTGVGIDPVFLPYIFDQFRQADASTTRRHGGLGLGLAIVRRLVELHHGSVAGVSDGIGHGSKFVVEIPLAPSIAAATPVNGDDTAYSDGPRASFSLRPVSLEDLRVLVVDDEPDARVFLKRLLDDRGASVTAVGSGAEALARLTREPFDVIVSDIGMPGEDGYAMIRRVRALPEHQNGKIPAIALTAYARNEDRLHAISAGFNAHLAKPVEAIALFQLIHDLRESPNYSTP